MAVLGLGRGLSWDPGPDWLAAVVFVWIIGLMFWCAFGVIERAPEHQPDDPGERDGREPLGAGVPRETPAQPERRNDRAPREAQPEGDQVAAEEARYALLPAAIFRRFRAFARTSSSTPCSRATSRSARPLAVASFTIAAPLS